MVTRNLLSQAHCDLLIDFRVLRNGILVGSILFFFHDVIFLAIFIFRRTLLRVRIFYVFPDVDAGPEPQLLQVFVELICAFLDLSSRTLV